jgi:DNA polymerase elongation subunit (family B)
LNKEYENMTKEELEIELKNLISNRNNVSNLEKAIKRILVSSYGVFGNKYFNFFNKDIAETIALQGQTLIKFSSNIINKYFLDYWHKDKKLHKILNVTDVKPIDRNLIIAGVVDSLFVDFNTVINSCKFEYSKIEFILNLYNYRLKQFIKLQIDKFSNNYNTNSIYNFELKSISEYAAFFSKNHYILSIKWANDIVYESLEKFKIAGIEIINKTYPKFARDKLNELMKYFFKNNFNISTNEIIEKLKNIKKQFKLQDINDISMSVGIGEYEKYVTHKKNEIIVESKTPIHIKAAANYNSELLKNRNFRNKYMLIRKSSRIKYFYSKGNYETFAFINGYFPIEFAPEFDYDKMFYKLIVEPIQKFMKLFDKSSIPENLITFKKIF